jgi:dynein heavy chain
MEITEMFNVVRAFDDYSRTKECTAEVSQLNDVLEASLAKVRSFNEREMIFKLPLSSYDELENLHREFQPYLALWNLAGEFDLEKHLIMNGPFQKLNSTTITKKIGLLLQESIKLSR